VGTSRRIVVVESGSNVFLAPDNGLLHFVIGGRASRPLTSGVSPDVSFARARCPADGGRDARPPGDSNTFHGRDRFAPLAAAIANGVEVDGPRVDDLVALDYEEPAYGDDVVRGTIVAIDRFGNVITDIERSRIPFDAFAIGEIDRLETNYGDAAPGPFLIVGSTGHVEISMRNMNAAQHLQLSRRSRVELCRIEPPREKSSRR